MRLSYRLSVPDPASHLLDVEMTIAGIDDIVLELSLPVWTPGSYLVREYAQHIERLSAFGPGGGALHVRKKDKNTWVLPTAGLKQVHVQYTLYAFDPTVRTNFADAELAVIIGAATFLYVEGAQDLPAEVTFQAPDGWKDIATALPVAGRSKWKRRAADYHELVDSPVMLGNFTTLKFAAGGVPHHLTLHGESNMDQKQFTTDLKKVCEAAIGLFGDIPCREYLFLLWHTENRYNGLEHLNCSLNQLPRLDYRPRSKYVRSIGLLSHEYFHLWNVKRIRPAELAKFDYSAENYTNQLWVAEGVTSYYDDYLLLRAGVISTGEYLDLVAKMLNGVVNTAGDAYQSLTEASHDAWIKYYRRNEHSNNSQVSYYNKGAMLVHVLNLLILQRSEGAKSFDDVMRRLYEDWKADPDAGYTEDAFRRAVEAVAGISLAGFFKRHIHGTEPVSFRKYFKWAGLYLKDAKKGGNEVYLGMSVRWEEGKLLVAETDRRFGACAGGLNTGDEILAIDGYRIGRDYERLFEARSPGEFITVTISRQGRLRELSLELTPDTRVEYTLELVKKPGKAVAAVRKRWLGV